MFLQVFGTAVNWRLTVTETLQTHAKAAVSGSSCSFSSPFRERAVNTNWPDFAEAWRTTYVKLTRGIDQPPSDSNGSTKAVYKTVDQHYRESLVVLLLQYELQDLWPANELDEISKVWHYLVAWPNSPAGLSALNGLGFQTCTLSNGNISLLEDMSKFANLPWIHVFSSEHFGAYKPSKEVYLGAVEKLGLRPEECTMVASHLTDLWHARKYGLKTIYVEREQEEGWNDERVAKAKQDQWVDIWVTLGDGAEEKKGFLELARVLACNAEATSSTKL